MDRRTYLRNTSLATAGLLSLGPWQTLAALAANNRYRSDIGIQLYTLRGPLKNDAAATMQEVAKLGYQQGELYNFPNCEPLISAARAAGLTLNSSHIAWASVTNPSDAAMSDFQGLVERANAVGLSHLVIPFLGAHERKDLDAYRKVVDHCNQAASIAKEAGIQLSYHNHSFEFQPMDGGISGFDVMRERFAPEMQFEVDVFWVAAAGLDPVPLLKELKGRVSQLHLKDLKAPSAPPIYSNMPKSAFKELGNGMIAMEPIIQAAEAIGVAHCHVEQDHSPDPLNSIRQSMAYLQNL